VALAPQPVVQLRDVGNNAVAQSGVSVTATIVSGGGTLGGSATATTNASGVAAFTNLSISGADGPRTLSFAATGLSPVTAPVTLSSPVVGAACPNEPSGYVRFVEQPWDTRPVYPQQSLGWIDDGGDGATKLSVVDDPSSLFPSTNHRVIAGRFPQGSPGGSAPFSVYRPFATAEQFRNLYICLYLKHSADFDNTNGNAGSKFLWPAGDQPQGALTYTGHNGSQMDFAVFQQGSVDRILDANLNPTAGRLFDRRGQWVRYEILLKANTSNSAANGELHVWLDGVKTHQYTNVNWQMSAARTWLSLAWNPTYGGGLNPVPREQYQYMDHIRVSGSNQ
jgi:hypothetical protein